MITLNLHLDETTPAFKGREGKELIHIVGDMTIASLSKGMDSGKPAVAFGFPLPDGRYVVAETSLALLVAAVRVLLKKHEGEF